MSQKAVEKNGITGLSAENVPWYEYTSYEESNDSGKLSIASQFNANWNE